MILKNLSTSFNSEVWNLFNKPCRLRKIFGQNKNVQHYQAASITGKAMRKDRPPRPAPVDFENRRIRWWEPYFDPSEERWDDNTKIVVVEGPPTAGKDKFAKALAEELEMRYMPQDSFDSMHIDPYGFDLRSLNPRLSPGAQYYDDTTFLQNPFGRYSASIQHAFLCMRYRQYIHALQYLFTSGQGIVLQRCPWSDIVFAKAMADNGYMSKEGYDYYKSARECSFHFLLRPHLVIYLDVPVSTVQERIKQRARPHEANSKALTTKYLTDVERNYKDTYLPEISQHAHSLVYDWQHGGDVSFVVDDIEQLTFEGYHRDNPKMGDWKFNNYTEKHGRMFYYIDREYQLMTSLHVRRFDCPEMIRTAADEMQREELISQLTEQGIIQKYDKGWNPGKDSGLLFNFAKWLASPRDSFRR